jgi:hypothetical protein
MKPQIQEDELIMLDGSTPSIGNQNFNYFSPAMKQMITQEDFPD